MRPGIASLKNTINVPKSGTKEWFWFTEGVWKGSIIRKTARDSGRNRLTRQKSLQNAVPSNYDNHYVIEAVNFCMVQQRATPYIEIPAEFFPHRNLSLNSPRRNSILASLLMIWFRLQLRFMKIPYLRPPRDSTLREFRTRFPNVWKEKSQGLVDSRGFTGDLFGLPGIPRDSQGYLGIAGFFLWSKDHDVSLRFWRTLLESF